MSPAASRRSARASLFGLLLALALVGMTGGCRGTLPGGTEAVNESFYDSNAALKEWVESLQPGMSKGEVFARLGRLERDFRRLNRSEIMGVLFGGEDAGIPIHFRTEEDIMTFLDSLEGYRITYKRVKRKHGFASPIRIQTDENGFDYTISLVFKDEKLYQKPFLTGGAVNDVSTKTIFDYLNPSTLFNRVVD